MLAIDFECVCAAVSGSEQFLAGFDNITTLLSPLYINHIDQPKRVLGNEV